MAESQYSPPSPEEDRVLREARAKFPDDVLYMWLRQDLDRRFELTNTFPDLRDPDPLIREAHPNFLTLETIDRNIRRLKSDLAEREALAAQKQPAQRKDAMETAGVNLREAHQAQQGGTHGPKPDYETARRVAEIVNRIGGGNWRRKLDEICDELDEEKVRRPKPWKKRGFNTWFDCCAGERDLVVKAIDHHLKLAKRAPETIS